MEDDSLGECVGITDAGDWAAARRSAEEARRRTLRLRALLVAGTLLAAAGLGLGRNLATGLIFLLVAALVTALLGRRVVSRPRGPEFESLLREHSIHRIDALGLARLLLRSGVIIGPFWFRARNHGDGTVAVHLLSLDSPQYRSSWYWFVNGV